MLRGRKSDMKKYLECCGNCTFYNGNCTNKNMKDNPFYFTDDPIDIIEPNENICNSKYWDFKQRSIVVEYVKREKS